MPRTALSLFTAILLLLAGAASAHTIEGGDANFVQTIDGPAIVPFMYLGAKHMVTGYDHLLFLVGVIFFLYRPRHVVQYVTLFAVGHSITLLLGVLAGLQVNAYLIDAIIGLSIVYKAFENIGGFKRLLGFELNTRVAVFVFGLFHGLLHHRIFLEPYAVKPFIIEKLLGKAGLEGAFDLFPGDGQFLFVYCQPFFLCVNSKIGKHLLGNGEFIEKLLHGIIQFIFIGVDITKDKVGYVLT